MFHMKHNDNEEKQMSMKPTRTEILTAWMTLVKVKATYYQKDIDEYEQTVLVDVLKMLDRLQEAEGKR
jgi:hypothetical protein